MEAIKAEGLKLPNCLCFKVKSEKMMLQINQLSTIHTLEALSLSKLMQVCPEARDFFISVFIANTLTLLLKPRKGADDFASEHKAEFEAAYDRIKPLVMQHLDFIDGFNMS